MSVSIAHIEQQMKQRLVAMEKEYNTIRAGRPTQALFATITISYNNISTPLTHVATISIPEARQVIIKPWDASIIDEIVKAILSSELSLNPISDGKLVRINFPPLSEERRREYAKIAKNIAEKNKIAVRLIRREANALLKKEHQGKEIAEDEKHQISQQIQNLTDAFIIKIDERFAKKEKEIINN